MQRKTGAKKTGSKKAGPRKPGPKKASPKKPAAKKATVKSAAKKRAAKHPATSRAPAPTTVRKPTARNPVGAANTVTMEERHRMIEKAAYFRSLQRGANGSEPETDWAEAEAAIDAMLREQGLKPQ